MTHSSILCCLFKLVLAGIEKDASEALGFVAACQRFRQSLQASSNADLLRGLGSVKQAVQVLGTVCDVVGFQSIQNLVSSFLYIFFPSQRSEIISLLLWSIRPRRLSDRGMWFLHGAANISFVLWIEMQGKVGMQKPSPQEQGGR